MLTTKGLIQKTCNEAVHNNNNSYYEIEFVCPIFAIVCSAAIKFTQKLDVTACKKRRDTAQKDAQ